jgi:hypothetical protein
MDREDFEVVPSANKATKPAPVDQVDDPEVPSAILPPGRHKLFKG